MAKSKVVHAESLFESYMELKRELEKSATRFQRAMGISVDQYAILHHILENPGKLTSATVADSRGISRAAVSRGISQLIRRGYVLQSYQTSDRRVRPLSLTTSGEKLERACHDLLVKSAEIMSDTDLTDDGSRLTVGELTQMLAAATAKLAPESPES
ncbi:MarR family winged helix-turn-helix transcriptional regulator [Levilactobacillus tujiorum]|uniref:MarR family transcriptional regulator n=1 Tax=Levilactobacillus tujiorum TaxID=2912243 RepID=A0ABX1L5M7_9LACO|nr:MarR family transcriptional regulator [Levilactobacillus tujiorum]MCH5465353.1 MarR family transcriptional regulator [Levilactobacillus tujiorum]NLR12315.1 MarR family transcriptional regulator [Lactobacillus sp. HBUAS51387]NLR30356.1 MarR family transcriptional regulator [Levilactobacillus tujiorum]NLR31949.1 MarR family transcriptional regulator [Levilactobacillus tujiorum]